ncbi:MAG: efflux RND transporter periplasmic adaptor subunit [Treponema sp.]|jgi:HlyD family secretion protein|nr:efflux RND transporter periplasmic adaptor subunit [Treponema sp.]
MKNRKLKLNFVWLAVAPLLLAACGSKKAGPKTYEFTEIRRGSLERSVSSSGTINPVATVKVLPQMSGKVEKINVDYNDAVRKGDILAELNTDMLRLQRDQQMAQVIKSRANYELQRINYRNQETLAEKNLISEYELKTSKTTLDSQAADLAVAEANLKVIETEINQYAFITSPIDGIVLERNINVGDTVVDSSSSNTSSIFVIAENLKEMQIEASVGELDVTAIHKGQAVRFTLESLPGRSFSGEVENLRLVPTVQSNVVSYTVIINVENQDGSLLPGMTCAVEFIVERSENILMAPNAALRYQPTSLSGEEIAEMVFNAGLKNLDGDQRKAAVEARAQARDQAAASGQNAPPQGRGGSGTGLTGMVMGGGPPMGPGGRAMMGSGGGNRQNRQGNQDAGQGRRGRVVVMRNLWFINGEGKLDVMRVRAGISNGSFTEISAVEDIEGRQVILREKI